MNIFAIVLGVFIGCSVAIFAVSHSVLKSNDMGNSKGDFLDFSRSTLHLIIKQDRIKRPRL